MKCRNCAFELDMNRSTFYQRNPLGQLFLHQSTDDELVTKEEIADGSGRTTRNGGAV